MWTSIRAVVIFALLGFSLLPIYWMVLLGFSDLSTVLNWPPPIWPDPAHFSLEGFRASADKPIGQWASNSIRLAIFATVSTLLVSVPAGYAVARHQSAEAALTAAILLISKMVPASLLIIPLYIFFRWAGVLYTDPAVVLAVLSYTIPFASWMMAVYFRGIPTELEDAARIDGAGPVAAFFDVTLPLAAPALAAVTLYSFIIAWNDYIFARTFLTLDDTTLSVGAAVLRGGDTVEWNSVMAVSALATIPPLLLFLFLQRYFVQGLLAGYD